MGIAWSSYRSKREEKAKGKRLRNEKRYRIPLSQCTAERSPEITFQMKDKSLRLRENVNLDERELITNEEWKLPKKNLRLLKDKRCLEQQDVIINEPCLSDLKTRLEAWQFYQFTTQHPLDKWTVGSLPNLYFTDL